MRKILFAIILFGSLFGSLSAQSTIKSNLTIQKATPMLYLNGTSAGIDFYNGDITLQQSSNTLTLSGGNLALGANSITMTGALGATGGRILKGWFTDIEVTNTIAGTASLVTGFTRNSGTLTLAGGHGITLTTTGATSLTLPTSGTLIINPMTTAGDLLVGGVSGAPTRLAAGTDGYTLTLVAGSPAWVIPAGGGGAMIYPLAGIPLSTGTSWGTSITNNSVQWDSSYVARLRWNGGATNLVAATGRTSLGGTTIGQNIFISTNPDAIRFLRANADNTATWLTAALFKTALSLTATDVSLGNVTNESKATMFTAPTFTGHPRIEGVTATGATGTGNLVFSASPTFSGTVTGTFSGNLTGNVTGTSDLVTGFTRNTGTLTLSGGHALTVTTTGITGVTLPTSGTLLTNADSTILHNYFETRVDSIVTVLADTANIEALMQIDFDTDTIATRAYARSEGGVSIGTVRDEIADSLNVIRTTINDTISFQTEELSDLAPMLADTIPLFVFGAGGGNAGDTTLFTATTIYGSFYNKGSDTLRITELRAVMGHGLGLDTLGVQVWWNDSINVETSQAGKLNTATLPIGRTGTSTSPGTTTGTTDTSFANSKIPPGVWVWCKTPYVPAASLKRKPVYLNVQISGYKIPKY